MRRLLRPARDPSPRRERRLRTPRSLLLVLLTLAAPAAHADRGLDTPAATPASRADRPMRSTADQLVALTFDDGPSAYTLRLLDVLDSLHVTATFLFLGRNAEAHPELVRAVRDRGHELGTHTYSHPHLGSLSRADAEAEIARGLETVKTAAGVPPTVFRAPFGDEPDYLREACRKLGLALIPLGVPGYDWEDHTPEQIADAIIRNTTAGSFILLHDGSDVGEADRSRTVAAVPLIVAALQARGFRFVTASQLLAARANP